MAKNDETDKTMSRSVNNAFDAAEARESGDDAPLAENVQEDRSPRLAARAREPGFFEQIFQMIRPRAASSLRQSFAEALGKAETGEGGFTADEQRMLTNLLGLHEIRVEDAMVPRSEIDGIELESTLADVMRRFEETGHSRMPVYDDGLDDPRGMIHIRDVVDHITRGALAVAGETDGTFDLGRVDLSRPISALGLVRKVLFVPPSMPAAALMARMQATRIQMALVIDEYGGTDGLVSLEDLIEIIVGDIEDEHDTDKELILSEGAGIYSADARADLQDVRRIVGTDFDISRYEEEADTIGGLVVTELGRIPIEGETVETVPGFRLEVLEADSRRVKRVRIVRHAPSGEAQPGTPAGWN